MPRAVRLAASQSIGTIHRRLRASMRRPLRTMRSIALRTLQYPRMSTSCARCSCRATTMLRAGEHDLDGDVFVEHIAYNAQGQRVLIAYGNGIMTRYAYDQATFRLARMRTEGYAPVRHYPTDLKALSCRILLTSTTSRATFSRLLSRLPVAVCGTTRGTLDIADCRRCSGPGTRWCAASSTTHSIG